MFINIDVALLGIALLLAGIYTAIRHKKNMCKRKILLIKKRVTSGKFDVEMRNTGSGEKVKIESWSNSSFDEIEKCLKNGGTITTMKKNGKLLSEQEFMESISI